MIKKSHLIILAFVLLFHIINNFILLKIDNVPPLHHWGLYYRHSVHLYYHLLEKPKSFFREIITVNSVYPPLLYLSALPFYILFDYDYDRGVLFICALYLGIFLFSLYLIGKELFNSRVGLLATILCSLFPGIFSFSRMFLMALPLLALQTLNVFIMIKSDGFRKINYSVLFGLILGLGMLMEKYHIIPLFGIIIVYTITKIKQIRSQFWKFLFNILIILCILGGLILPWYITNLNDVISQLRSEKPTIFFNNFKLDFISYYRILIDYQIGFLFGQIFLVLFIYLCIRKKLNLITLSWLIWPYFILSLVVIEKSSRYTMIILPAISLVISSGMTQLVEKLKFKFLKIFNITLISIFLIYAFYNYFQLSYREKVELTYFDANRRFFLTGFLSPMFVNWDIKNIESIFIPEKREEILLDAFGCWYLINDYINNMIEIKRLGIIFKHLEFDKPNLDYKKFIERADFILMPSDNGLDYPNVSRNVEHRDIEEINRFIETFNQSRARFYLVKKIFIESNNMALLIYRKIL